MYLTSTKLLFTYVLPSMLGRTYFPVTINGGFGSKCELTVSSKPTNSSKYRKIGIFGNFNYPHAFGNDGDSALAITSAYSVAVQSGALSTHQPVYLNLEPDDLPMISGASEGAAALLAFLGCVMPENAMITGFVDGIGAKNLTKQDVERLEIRGIDNVCVKADGAKKCGLTLIFPSVNSDEFFGKIPTYCIPVGTVSEAVCTIQQLKR